MTAQLTTSKKDLGDSRVRVEVEVAPEVLESELAKAAGALGRELKIPGFRKGKVPPAVVIRRVGRDAVLDEAVRRALPGWYEAAVTDAGISTVGDPQLDLPELPEEGSPLAFSIEVNVRPEAKLGDYKGLEVGRREAEVPAEEVNAELERLRESVASLETVDRPAGDGDFVVLDFVGTVDGEPFEGGDARGYLLEIGSGRLIPGFEDQLKGAKAGEERDVRVTFPEEYGAEHLAGKEAAFATTVKEVKEKRLPELDDDFAAEAGGFDTLDELRSDIDSRLREAHERAIDGEFREAVVDAAVAEAKVDVGKELVHAKAHEMWENTARRLQRQGLDPQQYLQFTGKDEHQLIEDAEPEAETALKREAVLAAVVETEGIEVSDDELLDSLRQTAAGASDKEIKKAFDRMRQQGRDDLLREDVAMRKAVDLMVDEANPISVDQAKARDKLWTPEKDEKEAASQQIWTPGS